MRLLNSNAKYKNSRLYTQLVFFISNRVENNAMIGESIYLKQKEVGPMAQNVFYNVKTVVHKLRPEKTSCKAYEAPDGYAKCIEKGLIQRY